MKTLTVFFIALIFVSLFSSSTLAHGFEENDLQIFKTYFEAGIEAAPDIAKTIVDNERINVFVVGVGDFGFTTKNGKVVEIVEHHENPTLEVTLTNEGYNALIGGEKSILDLIRSGDLKYDGVSFANKIRIAFANFFLSFYNFFSGFF